MASAEEIRIVLREELEKLEQKLEEKLQPVWKALGSIRTTFGDRLDRMDERLEQMERFNVDQHAKTRSAIGALKESIEARDFRLDEHGRRLTAVENDLAEIKGQLPRRP